MNVENSSLVHRTWGGKRGGGAAGYVSRVIIFVVF